jgi:hypothetical protein
MDRTMEWLNEPPNWQEQDGVLSVTTGTRTDFWRATHYGFLRDDGHLRFARASGDFTAAVTVSGDYRALYDQAGLMLRIDERHWIKAGVEYVEGRGLLSVVVTRDFSDWSTVPAFAAPDPVRLRLSRHGTAVRVEWSPADAESFTMLRLAYLPTGDAPAMIGPMCCSPERARFTACFRDFHLGNPIARALHG